MIWFFAFVVLALGAGVWIHRFFEGENLLADLWREWRLSRRSLEEWDRLWEKNPEKSETVVSLTTIPSRIDLVDVVLKGLLDQSRPPRRIYLNVPEWSKRENCAYVVPPHLLALQGVVVRRCEDWGPATKLLPTLLDEEADQLIMVVDDDRIHPRRALEQLEQNATHNPDTALTCAGWVVPGDLTDRPTTIRSNILREPPAPVRGHRLNRLFEIDVLLGVFSYAVRPRFFDLNEVADFSETPRAGFLADDVRTSALCRVPKMAYPVKSLSFLPRMGRKQLQDTALAHLNRGDGDLEDRNNTKAIRHYQDRWKVGGKSAT